MFYLSELKPTATKGLYRIQLLRTGEWSHPQAPGGKLKLSKDLLKTFIGNFRSKVLGEELPMNLNHDDKNFTFSRGWIKDLEVVEDGEGIDALVEPTPVIKKAIEDKEIKYVSAELDFNFQDKETGRKTPVIRGAAWTNVPYLKNMRPAQILNLADVFLAEGKNIFGGTGEDDDDLGEVNSNDNPTAPGYKTLAQAKDPDAKDDELPDQCRACKLLMDGTCPFKGVELKMAAAGDGTCPRYETLDALTYPDPTNTEDPMSKANGGELTLADLSTQVTSLSDALATVEKQNKLLSEALESERNKRVELSEVHRRRTDAHFLTGLLDDGRLTPAQVELAETILNKARGHEGKIMLSEACDNKEVDLSTTTLEQDVRLLLSSLEPQIDMSNITRGGVDLAAHRSGGEEGFDAAVEKKWAELKKVNPSVTYGEAARQAARAFGSGKGGR